MREMLFRGKRKDNGEWVEGLPSYSMDGNIGEIHEFKRLGNCNVYDVDPATVGQYTGLRDKNDKRIFEGDIVDGADFIAEDGYGVIQWDDAAWEVCGPDLVGTFHENYWGKEFEVIGNIHDNPELLEAH